MNKSYVYVMGEMINNLEVPITNVSFKITFYDYNQEKIETMPAKSWFVDIPPQRRTAFSNRTELMEGLANYTVAIEHYDVCLGKPFGLAIAQAQIIVSAGSVAVDGYIKNNGSETTMFLDVIAFFYGKDGFLAVAGFPMALQTEGGIIPKDVKEFRIPPCKYVNETNFEKCILTVESLARGGYAGYAVEKEITIEWNKEGAQYNYYWVFVFFMMICVGIVVVFILKKKKKTRKIHHGKTRRKAL